MYKYIEIKAICELVGLQGIQFFSEKLSRMIALLIGNLKVNILIHLSHNISRKLFKIIFLPWKNFELLEMNT